MLRRLITFLCALSLLLFVATAAAWVVHEALGRPLTLRVGSEQHESRFLAVDQAAVLYARQWVVPVEEGDPSLGRRGFSGASSFGEGTPDLSEYHTLRNGEGRAVLQWSSPRRLWLPERHRPSESWLLEGPMVRRVGADGQGRMVQTGYQFHNAHVAVPLWIILAATAGPSLLVIRRTRRARRARRGGVCPTCGHDLRGSPGPCPQCGAGAPDGNTPVATAMEPDALR